MDSKAIPHLGHHYNGILGRFNEDEMIIRLGEP